MIDALEPLDPMDTPRSEGEMKARRDRGRGRGATEFEVRERFVQRYAATIRRIAEVAPTAVLLKALANSDEVGGLAAALSESLDIPRAHDPLSRAKARATQIKRRLLEEAGGACEAGDVAELLGITPQAVHQRRNRGALLAVQRPNGQWMYPRIQFEPIETANRMGEVLSAFKVNDSWARLSVLLSRTDSLGGRRPIDVLREGDVEGAILAVASFGAADE